MTWWFVYEWGKPTWQKSHRMILRSQLPRIHHYLNKRLQVKESQYLIPTYSWTLTPIPSWIYSVVTISPFQYMAPSMWLTNCADPSTWLQSPTKKIVGCKVLQFIHTMKIRKMLGHKILWCKYTATSPRKRWTRSRILSPVTICLNRVCSMLVQLVYHLTALKTILLYV